MKFWNFSDFINLPNSHKFSSFHLILFSTKFHYICTKSTLTLPTSETLSPPEKTRLRVKQVPGSDCGIGNEIWLRVELMPFLHHTCEMVVITRNHGRISVVGLMSSSSPSRLILSTARGWYTKYNPV